MARNQITTTLFFNLQGHGGPFISPAADGADIYCIFQQSDNTLRAWKSGADPLVDTWAEQDSGNRPANVGNSCWVHQSGSELHVANIDNLTTDLGRISYHVFNTNSDTWTTRDTVVSDPSADPPLSGNVSVFIYEQTDGDIVVVGAGENDRVKGTDFDRIDWWRDTGAGFSAANALDDAGEIDYRVPCGLGVGNRVHVTYVQRADGATNWTGSHKTIRDADTLSSRSTLNDLTPTAFGKGVTYDDEGTTRCRMPAKNLSSGFAEIIEFDDADSPTVTETTGASDNVVFASDGPALGLAVDAKEVWMLYSDTVDIFYDKNNDDGGWGTDVATNDGVDGSRLHSNVITRNGLKRLAYTYRDGATAQYYNELDIGGFPQMFKLIKKRRIAVYLRL